MDVEELAVPGDVVDEGALERLDSGGSKVLSALNAAMWTLAMARPSSRPFRSRASASTSGSSGTRGV